MPELRPSDGATPLDVTIPSWVTRVDTDSSDPADIGGDGPCLSLSSDKCAFNTVWSAEDGAVAYIDAVTVNGAPLTVYELRQLALWATTAAGILETEQAAEIARGVARIEDGTLAEVTEQNREAALSAARHFAHLTGVTR
jgi:hypothetical protein